MGSLKLGTKLHRWLKGSAYASAFSLSLFAFGIELAHGQSVADTLKMQGGIAGLMAACDGDMSGWEKIEQFLAKSNSTVFRSYLQESFTKAQLENVVAVNGVEQKLPCDALKSTGMLVKMKQVLITNMNDLINAP